MSNTTELARAKQKNRMCLAIATLGIVAALAFSALYFWSQRPSAIRSVENPYPLIDLSRNFVAQEHYLATLQPLRVSLNEIVKREAGKQNEATIYFEYLNTGANIVVNSDLRVLPASLTKLPLALTVMKKVEDGEWRLDDELVLLPGDANSGSGTLHDRPVGTRFTIEILLKALLQESDNTAFNIFSRNLKPEEHLATHEALGIAELFDAEGRISAKEYSRFFRTLYTASFLNRESSHALLTWLSESTFDEFLSATVPENVPFPHKFGINVNNRVFLDSGIGYIPNRPYLITVLIHRAGNPERKQFDREESARIMKEISETAYAYIISQ